MPNHFSAPETVGKELSDFADFELTGEIQEAMRCQPCNAECDGCDGFVALCHLENQIGKAGIKFMRELLKEWAEASVEGGEV